MSLSIKTASKDQYGSVTFNKKLAKKLGFSLFKIRQIFSQCVINLFDFVGFVHICDIASVQVIFR